MVWKIVLLKKFIRMPKLKQLFKQHSLAFPLHFLLVYLDLLKNYFSAIKHFLVLQPNISECTFYLFCFAFLFFLSKLLLQSWQKEKKMKFDISLKCYSRSYYDSLFNLISSLTPNVVSCLRASGFSCWALLDYFQ